MKPTSQTTAANRGQGEGHRIEGRQPQIGSVQQAAYLEVGPGIALLVIKRVSYTTGDEPVYIQELYYRPDRVQYRVMLRRYNYEGSWSKIDEFSAVYAK